MKMSDKRLPKVPQILLGRKRMWQADLLLYGVHRMMLAVLLFVVPLRWCDFFSHLNRGDFDPLVLFNLAPSSNFPPSLPLAYLPAPRLTQHAGPLYRLNSTLYNETKGINRNAFRYDIKRIARRFCPLLRAQHQELNWHLGPASRPSPQELGLDPKAHCREHLRTNCW